ncbi:MAG: ABC transporter ATP-binding protein [Desulfobacterales bacterium]|nr:ABC transporter ATP-binding protein [Desulfobacterales bacterium]
MLELINVNAFYGNIHVLKNINIKIEQGEIITLIGANGAGKTTTLMTISGIVPVQGGEIKFLGNSINKIPPDKIVAQGISQVPEGRRIFQSMTVTENLDMGTFLRKNKEGIKKNYDYIFSLFPILYQRKNQIAGTLSGGEQQMLAISRALMAKPRLLLMDEPSLGLAPIIVKRIFDIVKKINKEHNTTIFLVEQNANLALKTAQKGYIMANGSITHSDLSHNLLSNEDVRNAYLGV